MKTSKDQMQPDLLKKRGVGQVLNLTDPGVTNLQRRDPTFPRPIQLGSEFSLRWVKAELLAWIEAQPRRELSGIDGVTRRKEVAAQRHAAAA